MNNNFILVAPDAGASKKIFKLANKIGYTDDIIICGKDRDENGKLTRTIIPPLPSLNKDIIIIDDICSKGNTFINIAKEIKKIEGFTGKIYLVITHYEGTADIEILKQYFNGIYCTNSICDINNDFIKQLYIY